MPLKLQFDPNQPHQHDAVEAIAQLFNGLPRRTVEFSISGEIHASIKGLNPEKRVPVPGAPNAEPLEYEYLLMLEREGDETCRVKDGNRLVTVNVRQILSGIESESRRRESGGNVTNIYVGGNVDGNMVVGDENDVNSPD